MEIIKQQLSVDNYIREETKKNAIVIHHTAGSHNPANVIAGWNSDAIGRIATHYVIGGIGTNGETKYDGVVYQAFDEKYYAYHLGIKGNQNRFDKQSIGIELCNYGYAIKSKDGKFYNYVNRVIPDNQVVDLGFKYRGYQYWQKYTDKQLESLELLIEDISKRHGIPFTKLNCDFHKDLLALPTIKGIYTHTNFRNDKFDCYPYPKLLNSINK